MKNILLTLSALLFALTLSAQDRSVKTQLLLRFDEEFITKLQEVSPNVYRFYAQELLYSFEFVDLEENKNYPVLEAYDYHTKMPKEAPLFINFKTFSLYDYKFDRHPTEDIIYKIPNSLEPNKGVKVYSKKTFREKI